MAHDSSAAPASISIEQHLARVLESVTALPAITVPIAEALHRTLAVDVHATADVPGFDNSAMDGYALRRADAMAATVDSPVTLTVVADLPAGSAENPRLQPGEAARIMTGAPVPDDADCIVPIEDTDEGTATVLIYRAPAEAAFIRPRGTDVQAGDAVLPAGRVLGARDLAAAAASGVSTLAVHPAPRVGVLSTGSELREPGDTLARGQIHDSNSLLLEALITECGGIPVQLGSVPDDDAALRAILDEHAPELDAVITSGGVSVGAYDVVKAVLAPLGVWFGPVRMQPGKPQGFGRFPVGDAGGPLLFALPGNPVSVFVSFETFVRPALLTMTGHSTIQRPTLSATVTTGWRSPAGRAQYMPAVVERDEQGAASVRPASAGGAGSYLVASLASANALAFIPEDVTEVREGDTLTVTLVS
ncbi:molybdopterin molybdotransferase [Salinibacterium amurskyense]|uniref:Molybdopterin molybdenumtransferase n=1 Tax=Salinibacterium amurskyense TaxID=205941 RepID=A0A2M9D6V5_9MICO|nr:gephyrin-like molybdotransferase Glp [Salinibacterium amurskyense]PJJ81444.1 molybdopterin molybdotransferase [Salinibacterium amurskyense]RLQ83437.1 molybdopterin molybdenumtransferase MoeA [Salinibacterium amurskyense]GHD80467.1 molybdopterin molybdenumtransferase MoeA [Salinibacterium amurskyense]